MTRRAKAARLAAGALALVLSSCASTAGEKGRLVPAPLGREALDQAYAPRKLALLVGVGRFDDGDWKPLRYPGKDAADLAAVLRDPARGGFDQVEVLAADPTRAELRAALARLADQNRDERDTVLVYFSSHGTLARDGRGELRRWLVARDTRIGDVIGTGLALEELRQDFDRLRSRRKVLVLAACHSGSGKSLLPPEIQQELAGTKAAGFLRPIEEVSRASVVLAASDWGETAREDERLQNDIYTHFLVEALRGGGDRNGDGAVTASEAHDYARRRTYEFTGGRQRPSAESTEVGVDPIVLVGKVQRRGKPEVYSYAPMLEGFTVSVDGRPAGELPGGVAMDAGTRHIQVQKGGGPALIDESVSLAAGERLELEALLTRARGAWDAGPRLGVMGFLGSGRLLPAVYAAGATATRRDWPAPRLALRLDVLASSGRATYRQAGQSAPYDYQAFSAGVAVPYRYGLIGGRLQLFAGPRLSLVSLRRRFQLDLAGTHSYLTFTPGVLAGLSWESGRWLAGLEAQADWVMVRVDGRSESSGFGALVGGIGWRF
ncbi:MAG: caspase family protein [Deltaproteobacteria bacterium]|nr:caspase family protein [Deltaproteobacteria bacterium]